jgi:hypothetical protein
MTLATLGRKAMLGRGAGVGLRQELGHKGGGEGLLFSFFLMLFPFKTNKQFEFKSRFESNTQKQCTGMNATVNSYISLSN